jgi:hypothetical protein
MNNALRELLEKVSDEKSFVHFVRALREDCESERSCPRVDQQQCLENDHWETRATERFLHSAEEWASGGDFYEGVHHGEPILRRVATMLYVARSFRPEDRHLWNG